MCPSLRNVTLLLREYRKAVNSTTNKVNYYTIAQSPQNPFGPLYTLRTSYTSQTESIGGKVVIYLSQVDVDAMMYQAPNLALGYSNTFLSMKIGAIADQATPRNFNLDIFFRYGMQVTRYIRDVNPPAVAAFDFSLQTGFVDFYFNKVINCSSIYRPSFVFQYAIFTGTSNLNYPLDSTSAIVCDAVFTKHIHVDFGPANLIVIKAISLLFKSKNNTYLRYNQGAIYDAAGNPNAYLIDGSAIQVRNFFPDTVSPSLLSFTVTSLNVLMLTFDEPVDTRWLYINQLFFQDGIPFFNNTYSLVTTTLASVDSYKMNIGLQLSSDYSRIRGNSKVFQLQSKTFFRLSSKAIRDMSGNQVVGISSTQAVPLGPSITVRLLTYKFYDHGIFAIIDLIIDLVFVSDMGFGYEQWKNLCVLF